MALSRSFRFSLNVTTLHALPYILLPCSRSIPSQKELKVWTLAPIVEGTFASLCIISSRAFLVKVIARIALGGTERNVVRYSMRLVRTVVFPEPGPAMQRMLFALEMMAFFCSSL